MKNIVLPIGISFYTFQLLTYVVDVYRREAEAQKSFWNVLLYASLFHQCIAGPIVRYASIDRELFGKRTVAGNEQRVGQARCRFNHCSHAFFLRQSAYVAKLFFSRGLLGGGKCLQLNGVDKVTHHVQFVGREAALSHFLRHELTWTDEGVGAAFKSVAIPLHGFDVSQSAGCERAFHAALLEHLLFVGKAQLAWFAVAQTGV